MLTSLCFIVCFSGPVDTPAYSEAPLATLSSDSEALAVRVRNGRCEMFRISSGSFQRSFGNDIVQASCSGDYVAAVRKDGHVEIYRASTGSFQRSFGHDAVSAQIQGDDVAVTRKDGRMEIYRASTGSFLRSM